MLLVICNTINALFDSSLAMFRRKIIFEMTIRFKRVRNIENKIIKSSRGGVIRLLNTFLVKGTLTLEWPYLHPFVEVAQCPI